ncbi:hypothetical protein L3X38_039081 [Prunus dulcis]|uniref:Uncharacterized protein n=1 Tax=Prunus dulcis TaxID=3755 RepID=A0AAD4YST6_PRUDU|nr:hypothetical protein L3X38_039081 [Prunus dulcis]
MLAFDQPRSRSLISQDLGLRSAKIKVFNQPRSRPSISRVKPSSKSRSSNSKSMSSKPKSMWNLTSSRVTMSHQMSSESLGGPSPSHILEPKILGGSHARDGGFIRKEIKDIDDNPEYSKRRDNQAIRKSPSL